MKRVMVILAMALSTVNLFASELVVKGNIDAPFSVFINGEKYYSYNNKVNVSNLMAGNYNIEIYTEGRYAELLYDYRINVPSRSTVYATFYGDHKMYISTEKNAPAIVVNLTPFPHRHVEPAPAPKPVHYAPAPKPAPKPVVHSTPKHDVHHPAPAPKKDVHHAAPAPNHKPAVAPKPSTCSSKGSAAKPADTKPSTPAQRNNATRSTVNTRR